MRSDIFKKGYKNSPQRSLLKALGLTDREIQKPIIGIASSSNEIIPGHIHLKAVSEAVKKGVIMGGGTPLEFNTIGICDGIAMNHKGMSFSLPSRELITDSIEIVANATPFDGMVFISNCDKITPGMLMAMGKLNLPSILISGGPMLAGSFEGKNIDLVTVFEAVGEYAKGEIDDTELSNIENLACPGAGSCAGLFTANSMNAISEALGVSLPGNGTIPAVYAERIRLAKETGHTLMNLVKNNIKPRDIVGKDSLYNAVVADLALGGSSNTVLHLKAIAHSFEVDFNIDLFDELSRKVPHICNLSPVGPYHIQDLYNAGGVYAILNRLSDKKLIEFSAKTVLGKSIGELIKETEIKNSEIIRPLNNPYNQEGGLGIFYGNLAKNGAVAKTSGIPEKMKIFKGPAVVFDNGEDATDAILNGKIKKGDVVVIRYEGPKGGPGMREMLSPTSAIIGMGLINDVALITDGRFSGGSKGAVFGHISPEAAEGGLIQIVKNNDTIAINVNKRTIELLVNKGEIRIRYDQIQNNRKPITESVLKRYASQVQSSSKGAVFKEE